MSRRLTFCSDIVSNEWSVSRKLTFCPDIVSNEWLLLDFGYSFDTTAPEKNGDNCNFVFPFPTKERENLECGT